MKRNTKEVDILGERVYLSERSAQDIFTFLEMVGTLEDEKMPGKVKTAEADDFFKGVYTSAFIVNASLAYYIADLKFYRIFRKLRLTRKFRVKNLMDKLSIKQLTNLSQIVAQDLEGLSVSGTGQIKKKAEKKSVE